MATDTQLDSWDDLQKTLTGKQLKVFFIIQAKPSTGREIAEALKSEQDDWITPRIAELRHLGMVQDSGLRRVNEKSRKKNIVWEKVPGDKPRKMPKKKVASAWAETDGAGNFLRASPIRAGAFQTPCKIIFYVYQRPGNE